MNLSMRIGELARRADCPAETIRYYEREGLLPEPARTGSNYRLYGRAHLEQLSFIRNCRSLDMTLNEISQLLRLRDVSQDNCREAHALLDEHIVHVRARIAELQCLERQLKTLRRQCRRPLTEKDCGILNELGHGRARNSGKKSLPHVRGAHRS